METDPETERREFARSNSKHWENITAEDIPPGWIDTMVKRLFDELNRQLLRVERTSCQESDKKNALDEYDDDPDKREKNARILGRLQTSLERLTDMEMERAALRTTKAARTRTESRSAIRRRVLAATQPKPAGNRSGESQ